MEWGSGEGVGEQAGVDFAVADDIALGARAEGADAVGEEIGWYDGDGLEGAAICVEDYCLPGLAGVRGWWIGGQADEFDHDMLPPEVAMCTSYNAGRVG